MTQSYNPYDQNEDERDVTRDHNAFSATGKGNTDAKKASARHNDTDNDTARGGGEAIQDIQTSRPRARRTSTRNTGRKRNSTTAKADSGIIQFTERSARNGQQPAEATAEPADDTAELSAIRTLNELKAQGFTTDEAIRLIHVSDRLANGREARESQTTLRRLRFTRWLIEHGVLDEFTA